jgi:hypothetical protein
MISHYASRYLHPNAKGHGYQHAFVEKQLIECVVNRGWLDGKLKRLTKPAISIDTRVARHQRIKSRIKLWEGKRKRAENALKKLRCQDAYCENLLDSSQS